jgi:hypothetical protein
MKPEIINQRCHAAWLEMQARVSLRQQAIHVFLTASAIVFGFYFTSKATTQADLLLFLLHAVSCLSLFTAALIWNHNEAIAGLVQFMFRCEAALFDQIESDRTTLFYFLDDQTGKMSVTHLRRRNRQRISVVFILAATNGAAMLLAWPVMPAHRYHAAFWAVAVVASITLVLWRFHENSSQREEVFLGNRRPPASVATSS